MSNTQANMTVVSKEIAYNFASMCYATRTMNTQYDDQYQYKGAAAGATINIKQPHRVVVFDGATITTVTESKERTVALPRATHKGVDLGFTADEMGTDLTKEEQANAFFGKVRLNASVQALAAAVDVATYANVIPKVYNSTRGGETTNPSSYGDIGQVKAILDDYHTPPGDRSFVLTNQVMVSLNAGMSGIFNPAGKKSEDYNTGELADINGFMFYNSSYLPRHVQGSATTATVKTTLSVEGVNSVIINGLSTNTITAGSVFTIAGVYRRDYVTKAITNDLQQFVALTASATVAGEATVTFSPAIETLATNPYATVGSFPLTTAVVTFDGVASASQSQSIAYHKDAFVIAFVDLPNIGCVTEQQIRDTETGIALKLTGQGDVLTLKSVMRLDILFGSTAVNPWWACRMWGI